MAIEMLFLHGAGGFHDDQPLAAALASELGAHFSIPELPDEDMSVAAWTSAIRPHVDELTASDVLVAHSFGASMLLALLSTMPTPPPRAFLLAMPNWGDNGWAVADYDFTGAEPTTALTLHHCEDDDVVPVSHVALNQRLLPSADVRLHEVGGHQFDGCASLVAADIRAHS